MGRRPTIQMECECPSCGAIWGTDEMQQEICFGCGYPDNDFEDEDFDPEDEYNDNDDELYVDNDLIP